VVSKTLVIFPHRLDPHSAFLRKTQPMFMVQWRA
jgi:hypothetical protein